MILYAFGRQQWQQYIDINPLSLILIDSTRTAPTAESAKQTRNNYSTAEELMLPTISAPRNGDLNISVHQDKA